MCYNPESEVLCVKDLYVSALLDVYGSFLSEKQKALTEYYYNEDLSLSEIAENEGITRQGVNDLIKRAVAQLKGWEEKCGLCERILKLKELAGEVREGNSSKTEQILSIIDDI